MKSYQVPVIVTVEVTVDDDGKVVAQDAYADPEGGPWPYSSHATAYDVDTYEWHEGGRFTGDEPWENANNIAYDYVDDIVRTAVRQRT
jgi:hypothetical protein